MIEEKREWPEKGKNFGKDKKREKRKIERMLKTDRV